MLQGRGALFCTMIHRAPLPMEFFLLLWHHCRPGVIVFLMSGALHLNFDQQLVFPLAGAGYSPYPYVSLVSPVRRGYDRHLYGQKARATRRYVSGGPSDVLPSHCSPSF